MLWLVYLFFVSSEIPLDKPLDPDVDFDDESLLTQHAKERPKGSKAKSE